MRQNFKRTASEQLQDILNDYLKRHPDVREWEMDDVAAWALREGRWHPPTRSAIRMCASELAKAAREEYTTDPQGRRVRVKHARREMTMVDGKPKQMVFWEDARNASPDHMRVSLQQRRTSILLDNAQLKRDTDSYNENNPHGAHIQMSFDYTEDLLELEAPEDYPGMEGDDGDDE
ncbi:MAG TPA: hypothetical protein VGN72_01690 [Tepidisphaeraceae bacterium]|jgi:hypothetical protein|nr:hypothetical protein [Tepidisphaeraceae bacterium]